jgi:hypothetical protein
MAPEVRKRPSGVEEVELKWDEFCLYVREMPAFQYIYRGHRREEWKLSSPLERMLSFRAEGTKLAPGFKPNVDIDEEHMLKKFRDQAIGTPGVRSRDFRDDRQWLTLGRHHGLITRLLDWTRSPYVATFFAFEAFERFTQPDFNGKKYVAGIDDKNANVVIWQLQGSLELVQKGEFEFVSDRSDAAYRQRAQQGLFTWLKHEKHWDLESYLASRGEQDRLRCFVIPGTEMHLAIRDLERMNITFATLFPDLDGAARNANVNNYPDVLGWMMKFLESGKTDGPAE